MQITHTHTHTHTHINFENVTYVPEDKIRPLVGRLEERNILLNFSTKKHLISNIISVCGRYQCQKKLHTAFNEFSCFKYRYQL